MRLSRGLLSSLLMTVVTFSLFVARSIALVESATAATPTTLDSWCDWTWQHQETYMTFETCEAAGKRYRSQLKGKRTAAEALTAMLAASCYIQAGLTLRRMKLPAEQDLKAAATLLVYALHRPLQKKFRDIARSELALVEQVRRHG